MLIWELKVYSLSLSLFFFFSQPIDSRYQIFIWNQCQEFYVLTLSCMFRKQVQFGHQAASICIYSYTYGPEVSQIRIFLYPNVREIRFFKGCLNAKIRFYCFFFFSDLWMSDILYS